MEKVDASNLLRINLGASATEVEAAYRKRTDEVRKRFDAAGDRSTRTRCERDFFALNEARNILLAETEGVAIEPEAARAEPEAAGVESEAAPVEPEAPVIERVAPVIEGVAPVVERVAPVVERVAPVIKRVGPVIKRVGPVIKRVAPAVESVASAVESGLAPVKTVSTPKRPGSTPSSQKQWLALVGIIFILGSVSAIVFFRLRPPDGPKPGRLVFNTVPDNADFYVDGVSRGKTPLVLDSVPPGDRRLRIELPGYESEELIVSVKPGDEGSTHVIQLVRAKESAPK